MALTLKTAPAEEPITLAEAKAHLRETGTDRDTAIGALITPARQKVEELTGRALITQTWEYRLDAFSQDVIEMPKSPLASITSITYIDTAGAPQTLTAVTDYDADTESDPGRLAPSYGKSWPSTREQMNAVTIEFIAGYGLTAAVPGPIIEAIKIQLQILADMPDAAFLAVLEKTRDALLAQYRITKII